MKETTVLEKISKLVDGINYKTAYIEIKTEENKYVLEKDKKNVIGFSKE